MWSDKMGKPLTSVFDLSSDGGIDIVEFDPFVPLDIKGETFTELLMNWPFIFCKLVFVVFGMASGEAGEGGVARSDNDADNGTSTSV